jgi:hypothetical protein
MAMTQAQKDRKRLDALKASGGKNVLLRLRREETAALDRLCRFHDIGKGEMIVRLIREESQRMAALVFSDPVARERFIKMPPPDRQKK